MKLRDRTGDVLGRLFVLGKAGSRLLNGRKRVFWKCVCECGNEVEVEAGNLNSGHTKSCGCLTKDTCARIGSKNHTHNMTGSREYNSWQSAIDRCTNTNSKHYFRYGGAGITMCAEWINNFQAFLDHIGLAPENTTLDRIDNSKGYEPGNVRWATPREQVLNRKITVTVSYLDDVNVPLATLAEKYGIQHRTAYERFRRQGWSIEKTLQTPVMVKRTAT